MNWIRLAFIIARSLKRNQTELAAENLALRQRLAVLERQSKRPKLKKHDRIFWVWLSKLWPHWRSILVIVLRKNRWTSTAKLYFNKQRLQDVA